MRDQKKDFINAYILDLYEIEAILPIATQSFIT